MRKAFAVAVFAVGVLSCSDSSPSAPGSIVFTYVIGGVSLSFTATGNMPLNDANTPWAVGMMQQAPSQGSMAIAVRQLNDSTSDLVVITTSRTTEGSSPIVSADCDTISCTGFAALFSSGDICGLTSGSVDLTVATAKRLKGTFSGTGTCFDFTDSSSFSVSDGTFDVPVIQALPGGEIRAGATRARGAEFALRTRRRALLPLRP